MNFQKHIITVLLVIVTLLAGYVLGGQKIHSVEAAIDIQKWEYGLYVHGDKFNQWVERDDTERQAVQDILDKSSDINVVIVFDGLGYLGWELSGVNNTGELTAYIFKRPTE